MIRPAVAIALALNATPLRAAEAPTMHPRTLVNPEVVATIQVFDQGGPVLVITPDGVVRHPSGKPLADLPASSQVELLCQALAATVRNTRQITRCAP